MPLSNVAISLDPDYPINSLAYPIILELVRSEFSVDSIERIRGFLKRNGSSEDLIRPEALIDGGLLATEKYLYPASDGWTLAIDILDLRSHLIDSKVSTEEPDPFFRPEEIEQVLRKVRLGAPWYRAGGEQHPAKVSGKFSLSTEEANLFLQELRMAKHSNGISFERACSRLSASLAASYRHSREHAELIPQFPNVSAPGIYRREHASLIIRSATTTILVDPVCLFRNYPNLWHSPANPEPNIDAVFITHGHSDHFSVPSILHSVDGPQVPVIVPFVPRPNCLSRFDMRRTLGSFGQNVQSPQWWTTIDIGDISVDILPFYGEQPTRDSPGASPSLRNWGNCYRFNTPEFSVLVLVDSGTDPAGSMVDVVKISRRRRGDPDVLLCSLPVFLSPFFGGLSYYYLTLPIVRLRELFTAFKVQELPSVTTAPNGVPALCSAAGARHFLTYGNGFGSSVGAPISDVSGDGQPDEKTLIFEIEAKMRAQMIATRLLNWNPGDVAIVNGSSVQIRSADTPFD